jgi:diguanylate cyclase (GGDEF)-like protein
MDDLDQFQKDVMTGAYNRGELFPVLKKRIIDAKLHNEKLSILLVDIDHFKRINDKYGHLWGDEFLKYVANTLHQTIADKGLTFRYGGDEFVILFSNSDPRESFLLAQQFNQSMKKHPFLFKGRLFNMKVSCGLATYPDDARESEVLLKAADKALYFSKRHRRSITVRAGKIGLYRFKMVAGLLLKSFLAGTLAFFLSSYFLRTEVRASIRKTMVSRLLSAFSKTDARVILKDGGAIKGRIIAEDTKSLVIAVPLDKEKVEIILRNLESTNLHESNTNGHE